MNEDAVMPGRWVGATLAAMTLMISRNVGFTAWLSVQWIETETTQESVLTDIKAIKQDATELKVLVNEIYNKISSIPLEIDDDDRWYRDMEIEYQKRMESERRELQRQIDELKELQRLKNR